MSTGIDYNRVYMVLAVLEKRLGLRFSASDVYVNVIGGIKIEETASDTGMALAMISSLRDLPVPDDVLCIGELGLSGEVRAVSRIEQRVREGETRLHEDRHPQPQSRQNGDQGGKRHHAHPHQDRFRSSAAAQKEGEFLSFLTRFSPPRMGRLFFP